MQNLPVVMRQKLILRMAMPCYEGVYVCEIFWIQ